MIAYKMLVGVILLVGNAALAAVELPKWFSDGMVLQTNAEYGARSFLNGRAKPGEKVVVSIEEKGRTFPTVADANGEWEVQINHACTSASCTIRVSGEDGPPAIARGVNGGDVFFCSGQSNMVFPLKLTLNASDEMATLAKYPHFRFFMTMRDESTKPQFDLPTNGTCDTKVPAGCNRWWNATAALSSKFIEDFSAVCFMTLRDVARLHIGQRPVALIQSAWGGTRIESWMSARAIDIASKSVLPASSSSKPVLPPRPDETSKLYNAMVSPWKKFSVRAALWYQGEANADQKVSKADEARGVTQTLYYSAYLQAMIADWREIKGMGDFAFLIVSLPPSVAAGTPPANQSHTGRPEVRLAELSAAPHPGGQTDISGVAVTIDLGGKSAWGYDHPCNKNEISRRLALQTLHAAYALQQGAFGGPGSLWTGPVLSSVSKAAGGGGSDGGSSSSGDDDDEEEDGSSVDLLFEEWSASGLALKDVKAINIDGTRNDCTRCCAHAPPFDVLSSSSSSSSFSSPAASSSSSSEQEGDGTWTTVPQDHIHIHHPRFQKF